MIDRLVREEGKTILMSTHNLQEAQGLCNRLAILERGKVVASDTPDNLRHLVIDDMVLRIVFADTFLGSKGEKLIKDIEATEGVHSVLVEVDKNKSPQCLKIRVKKEMNLTGILRILTKGGFRIKVVTTEEPTLEEAFRAITNRTVTPSTVVREGDSHEGSISC
jgi:ABC-2 type transport system ATP-binding protein